MEFKRLHEQDSPLLIANVWDVTSASIAEDLGYQAIGTSSAAIAATLGYDDGEQMSFDELTYIVGRIINNCALPLTVDLESGYSQDALKISENIQSLSELGVVGVNIEDSIVSKERVLLNSIEFAERISIIRAELNSKGAPIFLNVRTDVFLLGSSNALNETLTRASVYQESGADGIFVPCIENLDDIQAVSRLLKVPLNVMCMPNLPNFDRLQNVGVKRISMGNFLHASVSQALKDKLTQIKELNNFSCIL